MLRGEIQVDIPEKGDWTKNSDVGAITILNKVINRILSIPLPKRTGTDIILGSVSSGTAFNTLPKFANLRFEVRSHEDGMADTLRKKIIEICEEISAEHMIKVSLNEIARRKTGGIGYGHPLVKSIRSIMDALDIQSKIAPSTGELSALIANEIRALQ